MKKTTLLYAAAFVLFFYASSGFSGQNIGGDKPEKFKYIQEPVFNGNVYFYDSGKQFKTTVILVHGVGEDASDIWSKLVPVLEKQYRVICFDLPGFGRSDKGNALYSPENYAAFIKWVYDKYVEGPMYLIGHSMGGAISLCYAGTYPDSLQRLVLVDAAGILHRTAFTKNMASFKITKIPDDSKFSFFNEKVDILNRFIEGNLLSPDEGSLPEDISFILENSFLRRIFLRSPQKIAIVSMIFADFTSEIENLKIPLFIIWGEKDPVAPLRTGKMLASVVDNSRLIVMPGLEHNPMIEQPAGFNELILKCLSVLPEKENDAKISPVNKGSVKLDNRQDVVLEGIYEDIEIKDCRSILLKNIKARSLKIINSWIEIENISINSGATGLDIADSIVQITGGYVCADVGVSASNSKIDLAGVKIEAKRAAVLSVSEYTSTVVFSICRIRSQFTNRHIHDIVEVTQDNPL